MSSRGYYDLVRRTPLHAIADGGSTTYLKDETKQVTGAFKFRGNVNYLLRNADPQVVTASTGNHGLGLSTAGAALQRGVRVLVPKGTPDIKLDKLGRAGAEVVISGSTYDETRQSAIEDAARRHCAYVPSFDHPDIIAGHRRLFDEALEQIGGHPERVYVPVGGGGLYAAALDAMAGTGVEVVGVELAAIPAMHRSLAAGHRVEVPVPMGCQAEGLAVALVGEIAFATARRHRGRIVLVDAAGLSEAMRWVWRTAGVQVEGAGAAAVAGLRADRAGGSSLCVLSGGNIDESLWRAVVEDHRDLSAGED
ncbi:threonine/serine dehydratase [Actinoplanes sp. TFC3]|uniref:threonine ammonia-lyase n=1 Tax=Actinoplanes sp. TFC3 TaxID=1710355 RepID=UPI00082A3F9D|nr:pyridoxal-phosphate dependent enzyme [Actinoplanes sp. TFC3]